MPNKLLLILQIPAYFHLAIQTWFYLPAHSKANLLTLGCGETKYKDSRAAGAQKTQFSKAFREKFLKVG